MYTLPLNGDYIRVCKSFYLGTLDVSQTRITNFHKTKNNLTGTPNKYKWSKNKNRCVPETIKESIREHIRSIPRVDSHYCRRDTNKEYIATPGLSLTALYREYLTVCETTNKVPGKIHLYRHIFNSEFNIAFHFPKTDRCDKCDEFRNIEEPTPEDEENILKHQTSKKETDDERKKDRENTDAFVVCFDLENVFSLPRANVSTFFYKRKLSVFHMTAHCSIGKKSYGAIWHEALMGRSGNDIASTVMKILDEIVNDYKDDVRIRHIILWSDSCVPQNRNSYFSSAIKCFMNDHPEVEIIEQKFCEPGHSNIQEVDNLHSRIEYVCRGNEIFSPVGLLKLLKRVNSLKVIQIKSEHFKSFNDIAAKGNWGKVPFTQVKSIKYEHTLPRDVKFKTSFTGQWVDECVYPKVLTRRDTKKDKIVNLSMELFSFVKIATPNQHIISKEKKSDIKSMLKHMKGADKLFMENLVK